jgi:hypothetical protein
LKILLAAALLAAPPTPAPRPAPPPPCFTRAEVTDLTLFLLPALLNGAAEQCRPSLPAGAYLLNGGRALSQRLMADTSHGPGAVSAIRKIAGDSIPAALTPETLRGLAVDMLGKQLLASVKPADCGALNEAAELLAPLPPENIGGLIAVGIAFGASKASKSGALKVSICPAPPPPR